MTPTRKPKGYPTSLNLLDSDQCNLLLRSANRVAIASGALLRSITRGHDSEITSCAKNLKILLEAYGTVTAELYRKNHPGS